MTRRSEMIGSLAIGRAAVPAAILLALSPPLLHRRALLGGQALEIGAALIGRHIADVLAAGRRGMLAEIRDRLARGVTDGDLAATPADIDALARYATTVVQGLSLQARDGATRTELETVVTCAMAAWDAADPMTDRERDVLRLAADGLPNGEIAARLHLAEGTVRNYLSTAITKLGVRNRIEAARMARDRGWL